MTPLNDGQSLQSYGLRLQSEARRPVPRAVRPAGSRPASRLRAFVRGRTV